MRETVKRPIDLACKEEERECDCGNDEFYECGATSDGESIYECTECGRTVYGLD